jgi:hypothetical protein
MARHHPIDARRIRQANRRAGLFLGDAGEASRHLIEDRPFGKVVLKGRPTWQHHSPLTSSALMNCPAGRGRTSMSARSASLSSTITSTRSLAFRLVILRRRTSATCRVGPTKPSTRTQLTSGAGSNSLQSERGINDSNEGGAAGFAGHGNQCPGCERPFIDVLNSSW